MGTISSVARRGSREESMGDCCDGLDACFSRRVRRWLFAGIHVSAVMSVRCGMMRFIEHIITLRHIPTFQTRRLDTLPCELQM